jgi:hypothetical protein
VRRSALTPLAILVAAVAVLTAVIATLGSAQSDGNDPSSTANGKSGTLALYEWLGSLGYATQRVDSSWDLAGMDVLISAAPLDVNPWSSADVRSADAFLAGGGTAIVALGDPTAIADLLSDHGVGVGPVAAAAATPSQPFPGSAGIASVPLAPPGSSAQSWALSGGAGLVPVLDAGGQPVAAEMRVGAGRLWLLGSEYPLSNDGLRRGSAAAFLLAALDGARGRRVAFDEVHHLPPAGSGDYGLSAVVDGPLLAAVLLGVVVALLFLLTSGRRLGRPLPRADPARVPSVLQHIEAVTNLLAHSRERGGIASRYAEELKLRVGRAAGVDHRPGDAAFIAALRGYGEERVRVLAAVLAEARRVATLHPGEAQLLRLAAAVDAVESEWGFHERAEAQGSPARSAGNRFSGVPAKAAPSDR